jgi:hypothetical protein
MSISAVGGVSPAQSQTAVAKIGKEAVEVPGVQDHDGDSDKAKAPAASVRSAASVGVNLKA